MIETTLHDGKQIVLAEDPRRVHVFSELDIQAVEAALGAERPLLLLGEPGIGKSQLAEAVAVSQGWQFVSKTVDALTEPGDLLWTEDAVSRLAEAQLAAASQGEAADQVRKRLSRDNFISPGVLWSAFDPMGAAQAANNPVPPPSRSVALIDEIDKAESSVPNGLLEALGAGKFSVPGRDAQVEVGTWPLIVITSNDERPLPKAFIRRCIVHHMVAPVGDAFVEWLVSRGSAYYPNPAQADSLSHVAQAVNADRETARRERLLPLPGLAEYLDLLRALFSQGPQDFASIQQRTAEIGQFFLRKASR
ncbi:ATPase AAA [Tateyamaria omphalii]|uniref:AAA family ATPase n=1 Tax=Tateyamaria omphalii TaxID=299262 RepID=UPI0016743E8E|nr:MoxR family ATPase [Tateyamaria omphalii]GGX58093.1 ATPase AAA [Tateyamaria omphalii]